MTEFSPSRLRLARERHRLFQRDLAKRCGVTPQTVSNWEGGRTAPSDADVATISKTLSFPVGFFYRVPIDPLPPGSASFRARTKMSARDRNAALSAGDLARELADWIEERFELPAVRLPDLSGQNPELAARLIRTEWMLGGRPIPNMIHLLESSGVLVFSLAQDCRDLDAFSFWWGSRPIVLLNTMKSAERSRIDAAHELFHLVAHREETGKKEEEEADVFAGVFLMPEEDVLGRISRVAGIRQLIDKKTRWGVSLAALVVRLHRLGRLSDWQYRSLFIEISKQGYRRAEPCSVPRERSMLLSKVFDFLQSRGINARKVASELDWPADQLHELLFGLGAAMLPLEGGAGGSPRRENEHLRLV